MRRHVLGARTDAISRENSISLGLRVQDAAPSEELSTSAAGIIASATGSGSSRLLQSSSEDRTSALPAGNNGSGTLGETLCKPSFGAAATCIVVAIRLESNGLSGMLSYEAPSGSEFAFDSSGDDGLCVLSNLEVLSVPEMRSPAGCPAPQLCRPSAKLRVTRTVGIKAASLALACRWPSQETSLQPAYQGCACSISHTTQSAEPCRHGYSLVRP